LPAILLGWLACGTAATVFTHTDSPNFLRTLVVAPAAAALAGMGLTDAAGRAFKREGASAIALLLAASWIWTLHDLRGWAGRPDVVGKFQLETIVMADGAKAAANPQTAVFVPEAMFGSLPFRFESIGADGIYPYHDWSFLAPWPPTPETQGRPAPARRIVFLPDRAAMVAVLRSVAPGTGSQLVQSDPEARAFVEFAVLEESGLPAAKTVERMNQAAQ
jgi:hypothetical protein